MVAAQGGDVSQIDNPNLLPQAKLQKEIVAPQNGTIAGIHTDQIGWATVDLGAGRRVKSDKIDHAVGLIMPAKVGNSYKKGEYFATIHANDAVKLAEAETEILGAINWTDEKMPALPRDYGMVG
jgi:pyrimidine-nucleoside phosphorylase